jgi:hypothetical protein
MTPAQDEAAQPVATNAPPRQPRLRRYLARRGRQLLRLSIALGIGLVFTAAVLEIYRGAGLIGLPDIGDPFDVAAFREFRIPADQDAFVLFRRAQDKVTRMPYVPRSVSKTGPSWSSAAPELRDWFAANRELLEMFQHAAERADGVPHPILDRSNPRNNLFLGGFAWLALLEASRLEAQGDMAGAWTWYRAIFRVKVHVMRRGSVFQRWVGDRNTRDFKPQLAAWAADRRTSVNLLRRALDEIKLGEPKPEWDAYSLKIEYLEMLTELDKDWGWVQQGENWDRPPRILGEPLPPGFAWIPYGAKRYSRNEPERSRRVLRLAFANWLAHAEEKDPRYRMPAVRATFGPAQRPSTLYFYSVAPGGPANAQRLATENLAEALVGTLDARLLLTHWLWPGVRTVERREHRELVILLAEEIYRCERGKPPASDEALVGIYLDHLPDDGSDETDRGNAPTIRVPPSISK